MSWIETTLGDECELYQPKTLSKKELKENGKYFVYGANGIIGKHDEYNHEDPQVLITCRGATCGTINVSKPMSWINGNAMVVKPKKNNIDSNFLSSYLHFIDMSLVITGAAQPQITRQSLSPLKIKLPPLAEQKRIAAILDKAHEIKAKRELALAKLNELAQSTFIEMFGDPVKNNKNWDGSLKLQDISEIGSGITKGRKTNELITHEVPYLAVSNVQDKALNLKVVKTINATEDEINRYRLQRNDLLLTEGGDPDKLGRGTLWNNEIDVCIHQNHIFRVRITSNKISANFLNWLVGSARGKEYFLKSAKQTTGIASINMTQLKGFPMLLPPLALQKKFDTVLNRIRHSQNQLLLIEKKTLDLISSLQNQAFTTGFNA